MFLSFLKNHSNYIILLKFDNTVWSSRAGKADGMSTLSFKNILSIIIIQYYARWPEAGLEEVLTINYSDLRSSFYLLLK